MGLSGMWMRVGGSPQWPRRAQCGWEEGRGAQPTVVLAKAEALLGAGARARARGARGAYYSAGGRVWRRRSSGLAGDSASAVALALVERACG